MRFKKSVGFGFLAAAIAASTILACEAGAPQNDGGGDGDGDGDDPGEICLGEACGDGDGDFNIDDLKDQAPAADCGNNAVDPEREACDDGNNVDGDGCWANCLGVEPGYICRVPGEPCVAVARCGDTAVVFPEQCDDGNKASGDGCSENCKVEIGWKCDPGAACEKTTCGDGNIEGAEMCEPQLDDGCTAQCQFAPDCSGDGACTSECGDGLVLGEDCDDGNRTPGDGCDSNCEVEEGYTCAIQEGECERGATGECIIRVPVVYRDFSKSHPNFEVQQCKENGLVLGKVADTLVNGIPASSDGDDCFFVDEWYTSSSQNVTFNGEIVLYDNGDGGFVNRWGPNGEPWEGVPTYENLRWCGDAASGCMGSMCNAPAFDPATETCWTSNWPQGCCSSCSCAGSMTRVFFDGNPMFFPLDGLPGALDDGGSRSKIGPAYGYPNYPYDNVILGTAQILHNFHFTSEVTFWFPYDADTNATLEFSGDDDVFVFINRRLALDLGGTHEPETDSFTISGANGNIVGGTGAAHGMETGNVYEIKVFHAERQTDGSTFKLTLSGFNSRRSDCTAVCGDGVIGFGEECDDGTNDGGYNECGPDCTLGAFCGDGVKQEGEACDDRDPAAPAGCSGCNVLVVK